eukprot:GHVL01026989.1.p1 GENE.GHVL01026989.1~~GHVL01026989.1.p1  ORF type:complete len:165 (-),score=42.45 GHVL01026989.1:68-562(-)
MSSTLLFDYDSSEDEKFDETALDSSSDTDSEKKDFKNENVDFRNVFANVSNNFLSQHEMAIKQKTKENDIKKPKYNEEDLLRNEAEEFRKFIGKTNVAGFDPDKSESIPELMKYDPRNRNKKKKQQGHSSYVENEKNNLRHHEGNMAFRYILNIYIYIYIYSTF